MKCSKLLIITTVACALLAVSAQPVAAKKKKTPAKKESAYEKLFKNKRTESVKGLLNLHKIDGRIYFEIPLRLMDKPMLMASTIAQITDNRFASVGEKPLNPIAVTFTKSDSIVNLGYLSFGATSSEESLRSRIDESSRPATLFSTSVKAYTPDSLAVVVDVTDFLLDDIFIIGPFSNGSPMLGYGQRQFEKKFKKELGCVGKIRSYADNFSVESSLSFNVTVKEEHQVYLDDAPFTVVMNRSFMLLPEEPMQVRTGDPRIGIFVTQKSDYSASGMGAKQVAYANRWRLEPSDRIAYSRGELVEPKKPIVFYIDDAFPQTWKKYIKTGIEQWNAAFEKIGFKNAVQTRDFPKDDPEFDPNNLKYSCIVYSPSVIENAMGPSWTDPRTGEILNASVYIYHNLVKLVQNWRFVQTAAADPDVRKRVFDTELTGDCIRYVVSHEVGHCLGLMHNMSSSAAIPVDSLRSPSFTQKFGTTYSIMDYARNNYVAQPGDKERGVRVIPPLLGEYDYFTIKWLYSPLLQAKSEQERTAILTRWITEKSDNPIYRYGKQQIYSTIDPSSLTEDLGDDAVKASEYGVANLKYILRNMNGWVGKDDPDYSHREDLYGEIVSQYIRYMNHVLANIGGVYLNERYEGDHLPSYSTISKERQKSALNFICRQFSDLEWLNDPEVMRGLSLKESVVPDIETSMYGVLMARMGAAALCASKTQSNPYTQKQYLDDIYNFVWKSTMQGKTLTNVEKKLQQLFLTHLFENSGSAEIAEKGTKLSAMLQTPDAVKPSFDWESSEKLKHADTQRAGYSYFVFVTPPEEQMEHVYFDYLNRVSKLIKSQSKTGSDQTQQHYKLLNYKIDQVLLKNQK